MVEVEFHAVSDGRAKRLPFSPQDRERVLQAALASDHPLIKWANLLAGCQGMRLAEIVEADCRDVRMRGWRYRDEEGKVHPIAELRDENKITKRRRA
jgi:integrase